MEAALSQTNSDLLHQVSTLRESLCAANVPPILERYRDSVVIICAALEARLEKNVAVLKHGVQSVYTDVLYNTEDCFRYFDLVNTQLAAPVIRYHDRDLLALSVLDWLHSVHAATREKPFGLSSGSFAIYPLLAWPAIYFLPVSSQLAVRYLPLLYHEFGHLLYVLSKPEMDDLLAEFQHTIRKAFSPRSIRDSQPSNDIVRQQILSAWREYWAQEIYCDAVGLTIGGASFLHAFSHFFRFRSGEEYFRRQEDQLRRRHPVTWLRVQLLLHRAERYGLGEAAASVRKEWRATAELFGVTADFQGTWVDSLTEPVAQLLDDMLEETSPVDFRDVDSAAPHGMIDEAWSRFVLAEGGDYVPGECELVADWLRARGFATRAQ
jgi:hypothetical protein